VVPGRGGEKLMVLDRNLALNILSMATVPMKFERGVFVYDLRFSLRRL
jgi:hypothetical protein